MAKWPEKRDARPLHVVIETRAPEEHHIRLAKVPRASSVLAGAAQSQGRKGRRLSRIRCFGWQGRDWGGPIGGSTGEAGIIKRRRSLLARLSPTLIECMYAIFSSRRNLDLASFASASLVKQSFPPSGFYVVLSSSFGHFASFTEEMVYEL